MIVERGGHFSPKKAIYVLKQIPLVKIIPTIYASMFSGILGDRVHHHLFLLESIFYHWGGGVNSHKCNSRRMVLGIDFPRSKGW
jgi:hypothetical protein